jgi:hypothetical protein
LNWEFWKWVCISSLEIKNFWGWMVLMAEQQCKCNLYFITFTMERIKGQVLIYNLPQ